MAQHISIPKPFANGDANEWFQRFEICCRANGWDDQAQALKLPTLLEGEALAVWLELSAEQQASYATAKKEISDTIMPMEFVSLEEFHLRKLRPGEALSVSVHSAKKLLDRAMPELEKNARDQLLLHQFLAGIPNAVSRQLRATGEIKTLDAAITRDRLLMTIDDSGSSTAAVAEKPGEVDVLKEQIALLTEQVAALSTGAANTPCYSINDARQPRNGSRRCFGCNRTGHLQHECPFRQRNRGPDLRRCFGCGKIGHLARNCRQGNEQGAPVKDSRRPYLK